MISRRAFLGSAAATAAATVAAPVLLDAGFSVRSQARADTPATLDVHLVNNTGSSNAFAYVTGQAIDNGNALMLLEADGQTPYYPASPSATGSPLAVDCAIPLNASGGAPITLTVPPLAGARLWFDIGCRGRDRPFVTPAMSK